MLHALYVLRSIGITLDCSTQYMTKHNLPKQHTSPFIGVGEDRITFRTSITFTPAFDKTEQNSATHSVFTHADEHEYRTDDCMNTQNCATQKTAIFFGMFG
jgi:hypothetical protein